MDKQKEIFESYAVSKGLDLAKSPTGEYYGWQTRLALEYWQAALALQAQSFKKVGSQILHPHDGRWYDSDGLYDSAPESETVRYLYVRSVAQAPQSRELNADHVICPACAHDFRAIPENVQSLLISAGFEPPFLSQERQEPQAIGKVQHFAAPEGAPVYVTVQWKGSPPKHGAKVYAISPAPEGEKE